MLAHMKPSVVFFIAVLLVSFAVSNSAPTEDRQKVTTVATGEMNETTYTYFFSDGTSVTLSDSKGSLANQVANLPTALKDKVEDCDCGISRKSNSPQPGGWQCSTTAQGIISCVCTTC